MLFEDKLKEKMNRININLEEKQLQNFRKYKELLLEWNEKINLTSITYKKYNIDKNVLVKKYQFKEWETLL